MIDDFVFAGHAAVAGGAQRLSVSDCLADLVLSELGGDDWFGDFATAAARGETVLTAGVPVEHVERVLADLAAAGRVRGSGGLPDRLGHRLPVPRGRVLGFEPIGFDDGAGHSWACLGGLVDDVRAATGIRPAGNGLIEAETDAREAARWLTASGLGDPKVLFWTPAVVLGAR
ncbi:hypothetical protein [Amycolatopsis sp. NBC_00438]|uniref:hypothetical protein n=1 Tax=Amycolatopsis sp. NBC_00438 TaxID=2903558 RepID=UPI002E1C7F4E